MNSVIIKQLHHQNYYNLLNYSHNKSGLYSAQYQNTLQPVCINMICYFHRREFSKNENKKLRRNEK